LADDEKVIRDGVQRILSREKVHLTLAENGAQAWELLQQKPFDLVLLDLMMPVMNGMEVLEKVRALFPDQIVLIITGHATVELAVEAMKRGAYDIITKPFTPDQLRLVVRRALEKRALQVEAERLRQEQEKSLKDIAREKGRIQTIIHCMASGVLVTDQDQNIVLHNPASIHLLRLPSLDLLGKPLPEASELKLLSEAIRQVLSQAEGPAVISQEFSIGANDPVYLRAHTAAVRGDSGEMLGSVTVLQDISYLKAMDQMKSEFVAMVSHELRAPLSAIQQQISVILEGLAGALTDKQRELLSRSRERADGLLELIRNLLDISKIEAGIQFQQKEPLQLLPLVHKTIELLTSQAEAKKQTLLLEADASLPWIHADPQAMEEILTNLIHNAIKYTPERGAVQVGLKSEGDYLLLQVKDNGFGISPQDLPRIFDRFYRVKNEKTRQIVGTGLGLPIVKRLVEAHLGYIQVESQIDQGTTVKVLLPVTPGERPESFPGETEGK
jgi:PAS domain S-box-containing protein